MLGLLHRLDEKQIIANVAAPVLHELAARLRNELEIVRGQGFAIDDEEIAPGLRCMAVPLCRSDGKVLAAISVSQAVSSRHRLPDAPLLALLTEAGQAIERQALEQSKLAERQAVHAPAGDPFMGAHDRARR